MSVPLVLLRQYIFNPVLEPGDALFVAWRKRSGPVTACGIILVGLNADAEIFFHHRKIAGDSVFAVSALLI